MNTSNLQLSWAQAGIDYEFPTHTEKAVPPKKESNDEEKAKTKVKSRKVKENPKNEEKMAKSVEDDKKTVLEQKNNITSSTRGKRGPGSTPEEDGPVKIVPGRMTRGKRKLAEQEVAAVSSPGVEGKKTDRKTRSKK